MQIPSNNTMAKAIAEMRHGLAHYVADVVVAAMDAGTIDEETARAILTVGIPSTYEPSGPDYRNEMTEWYAFVDELLTRTP